MVGRDLYAFAKSRNNVSTRNFLSYSPTNEKPDYVRMTHEYVRFNVTASVKVLGKCFFKFFLILKVYIYNLCIAYLNSPTGIISLGKGVLH